MIPFVKQFTALAISCRLEGDLDAFVARMSPQRSLGQTRLALWAAGILLVGCLVALPLYRRMRRQNMETCGYDPSCSRDALLSGLILFLLWAGVIWPLAWLPAAAFIAVLTALRTKPLGIGRAALLAVLQPWGMLNDLLHRRVFMLYQLMPGRQIGFPNGGESPLLDQTMVQRQIEADLAKQRKK